MKCQDPVLEDGLFSYRIFIDTETRHWLSYLVTVTLIIRTDFGKKKNKRKSEKI